jgi:hypothetical protein
MGSDLSGFPDLERLVFFSGQQLTARDLAAAQTLNRDFRWLHNRSLHAWGIGVGLGVQGQKGEATVAVQPGYGVDCLGREVVLTEALTLTVPVVAGTSQPEAYYLVARYRDDEDQPVTEQRLGRCVAGGAVRLAEQAALEWRSATKLSDGMQLVLAEVTVKECRIDSISYTPRRDARPSGRPYLALGRTEPGSTDWEPYRLEAVGLGVSLRVDTSTARFHTVPRYVAQVIGARYLSSSPGPLLAVDIPATADARPDGFTLRVSLPPLEGTESFINPPMLRDPTTGPEIIRTQLRWSVDWIGIEA